MESGEIDLCLSAPIVTRERIEWAPLFTEELFVIVPSDHRLSGRNSIRLTEIAAEPVITFKRNYGLRILTDQLFLEAGLTPHITFEGEEIMTVAGLVEAKLGVAVIPHLTGLDKAQLSFLRISEPMCHRTIGLAWVNERYTSPAAKKFRDFVVSSFR